METIRVSAAKYQDKENCLMAAAQELAEEFELQEWEVAAEWEDDERNVIVLTVLA